MTDVLFQDYALFNLMQIFQDFNLLNIETINKDFKYKGNVSRV